MKDLKIMTEINLPNGHRQGFGLPVEHAGSQVRLSVLTSRDGESLEEREIDIHVTEHNKIEIRVT